MNTPGSHHGQPTRVAITALTAAMILMIAALVPTAAAGSWNTDCLPDLWVIERHRTDSGQTKAHVLSGEDVYAAFLLHSSTALSETGTDHAFEFLLGDFNGDSVQDIYVIQKTGTRSRRTEVHVLNGADFYRSFLMAGRATALGDLGSGSAWQFQLADLDGDRTLDLYAIEKKGAISGQTEVHVLNGADLFSSLLLFGATTPIAETGRDASWIFLATDCNGGTIPSQR